MKIFKNNMSLKPWEWILYFIYKLKYILLIYFVFLVREYFKYKDGSNLKSSDNGIARAYVEMFIFFTLMLTDLSPSWDNLSLKKEIIFLSLTTLTLIPLAYLYVIVFFVLPEEVGRWLSITLILTVLITNFVLLYLIKDKTSVIYYVNFISLMAFLVIIIMISLLYFVAHDL